MKADMRTDSYLKHSPERSADTYFYWQPKKGWCFCTQGGRYHRKLCGTVSNLNNKVYGHIETWRNRPLKGKDPYVYVDGIYLKRNWGSRRKENRANWLEFPRSLKQRGLTGPNCSSVIKTWGYLLPLCLRPSIHYR